VLEEDTQGSEGLEGGGEEGSGGGGEGGSEAVAAQAGGQVEEGDGTLHGRRGRVGRGREPVEDSVPNELIVERGRLPGDGRRVSTREVGDRMARAVANEAQARLERVATARAIDEKAAAVDVSVQGENARVQSVGDDVRRADKAAESRVSAVGPVDVVGRPGKGRRGEGDIQARGSDAAAFVVVRDSCALLQDLAQEEEGGERVLRHQVVDVGIVREAEDGGARVAQCGEGEGALVHQGAHKSAPGAALLRPKAGVDGGAVGRERLAAVPV